MRRRRGCTGPHFLRPATAPSARLVVRRGPLAGAVRLSSVHSCPRLSTPLRDSLRLPHSDDGDSFFRKPALNQHAMPSHAIPCRFSCDRGSHRAGASVRCSPVPCSPAVLFAKVALPAVVSWSCPQLPPAAHLNQRDKSDIRRPWHPGIYPGPGPRPGAVLGRRAPSSSSSSQLPAPGSQRPAPTVSQLPCSPSARRRPSSWRRICKGP